MTLFTLIRMNDIPSTRSGTYRHTFMQAHKTHHTIEHSNYPLLTTRVTLFKRFIIIIIKPIVIIIIIVIIITIIIIIIIIIIIVIIIIILII